MQHDNAQNCAVTAAVYNKHQKREMYDLDWVETFDFPGSFYAQQFLAFVQNDGKYKKDLAVGSSC